MSQRLSRMPRRRAPVLLCVTSLSCVTSLLSMQRRIACLAAVLPALLMTGCAWKTYAPAPLDLAAADTAALERRLDDDRSRALLETNGVDLRDWPAVTWSRETLLLTLLDRHPDMLAARALVAAARAKAPAVRQPVNPDLSTRLENHSDRGGVSPWSIGAGLQFTLNQRPLLDAQGGVAEAEAAEAEVAAGEVAWRLYRALGDALLALQSASEATALARDAVALAEARVESVGIRHRYGAVSALEVQLGSEALLAARREQANASAALVTAQAQLGQALALPPGAADALRLAAWPVVPPEAGTDGEGVGPDAATARALAQAMKSANGSGGQMPKPCTMSQPSARSSASVASSSTPSATTFKPRPWARPTVDRTMCMSWALAVSSMTKVRSIFSDFSGSRRR